MIRNKLKHFVLYSIGEIVLVVIGILIALSIDNWNDERKKMIEEQHILIQLREEYQSNLLQLEEKISTREKMIESSMKVLNDIDHPENANKDSLLARLVLLVNDPTFDPIVNDLVVSGNVRLIRNEELKRLLTNWSSEVVAVQEVEKRWTKLVDEQVVPLYIQLEIVRDAMDMLYSSSNPAPFALDQLSNHTIRLGQSKKNPDLKGLMANRSLEGMISVAIGLNSSANLQAEALKKRINKILTLLQEEIHLQES